MRTREVLLTVKQLMKIIALAAALLLCASCSSEIEDPSASGSGGLPPPPTPEAPYGGLYGSARNEKLEISEFIRENILVFESLEADLITLYNSWTELERREGVVFALENGSVVYSYSGIIGHIRGSAFPSEQSTRFVEDFLSNNWILEARFSLGGSIIYRVYMQPPTRAFIGIYVGRLSDETVERMRHARPSNPSLPPSPSDLDDIDWWIWENRGIWEVPELICSESRVYIWREVHWMS